MDEIIGAELVEIEEHTKRSPRFSQLLFMVEVTSPRRHTSKQGSYPAFFDFVSITVQLAYMRAWLIRTERRFE